MISQDSVRLYKVYIHESNGWSMNTVLGINSCSSIRIVTTTEIRCLGYHTHILFGFFYHYLTSNDFLETIYDFFKIPI